MRELIRGRSNGSLTFYGMRAKFLLIVGLLILTVPASAQHLMRVRIDTVSGNAGDTVTVNVFYTFTGSVPFDLHSFNAKFEYDTSLAWIAGYVTSGTASKAIPVYDNSHLGIVCLASSGTDIDFSNPVLFRMRVALKHALSDTAWIHWVAFGTDAPVDSVVTQDGWARTVTVTAHTVLHAPQRTVHGIFRGLYPDSVRFDLPVIVSDILSANVKQALLTFAFDHNHLAIESVTSKIAQSVLSVRPGTNVSYDTARVEFESQTPITGNDTLLTIHFYALIGPDTVCTALEGVTWRPLNGDAKLGAADIDFDSACPIQMFGMYVPALVSEATREPVRLYPNPARDYVISTGSEATTLKVFDALGRLVGECEHSVNAWLVPPSLKSGTYRIIVQDRDGHSAAAALVIER
jgi:hypothetical protein